MTFKAHGENSKEQLITDPLLQFVAEKIQEPAEDLSAWKINRIRDDGAVDLYLPHEQIDSEGVPLDEGNIEYLIDLFDERAAETGGSGQRDAVVAGHVIGRGVMMLDGFHRKEVQSRRGVDYLHVTLELGLTYEDVVRRRLEYAKTHPEILFSRQVAWVQEVWEETEWCELIPNVLTAFRAFDESYSFGNGSDVEQIESLNDEQFYAIRRWVKDKSSEWGYSPLEIRENLARVEGVDPELIHLVVNQRGKPPEGKIGLSQLDVVRKTFPGEGDLQLAFANLIIQYQLTIAGCEALADILIDANVMFGDDVIKAVEGVDLTRIGKTKQKGSGRTFNHSNPINSSPANVHNAPLTPTIATEFDHSTSVGDLLSRAISMAEYVLASVDLSKPNKAEIVKASLQRAERLGELAKSIADILTKNGHSVDAPSLTSEQNTLVHSGINLVKDIADLVKKSLPAHVQIGDLIGYGHFGLIDAARSYDPDRGVTFEAFATFRIRGAMFDGIREMDHLPRSARTVQRIIREDTENKLTDEEIARKAKIAPDLVDRYRQTIHRGSVKSLDDMPLEILETHSLLDEMSVSFISPASSVEKETLISSLGEKIELLPDAERQVIKKYFYEEVPLADIGWDLGVSESRASQILTSAIDRLKKLMRDWV